MKHEIKVGLTVLISIIILSLSLLWVKDFQPNVKTLNVVFSNVSGLEIGSIVTVNGVKKGKVKTMEIMGSKVLTTLQLSDDVHLYENATAKLMMVELMTGKKIELYPGSEDYSPLAKNALIEGEFSADVPALVGFAGEALDSLRLLSKELHIALKSANGLIGDPVLQDDLKHTIKNMREASGDLVRVSRTMRGVDIKQLIAKIDSTLNTIHTTVNDIRPDLKATLSQTSSTLTNANDLITSLKTLSDDLKSNQSTLAGKFLNDSLFMVKLERTITNLDSVLKLGQDDGIKIKLNLF